MDLSDIVVRIDDVHLVGKSGTDKAMRTVNKFRADGQTIDLWIWHRTENDGRRGVSNVSSFVLKPVAIKLYPL